MTSPIDTALDHIAQTKGLRVAELRSFRPIMSQVTDGKRVYEDPVAALVQQDVQSLLLAHMPENLRTRFVTAAVPQLDPGVRAISSSHPNARKLYGDLSLPYLVALLGADRTNPEARLLHARRAAAKLGLELQRDPVFRQQQELLYRYRLTRHFPRLQLYLDDQAANPDDYVQHVEAAAASWSEDIRAEFAAAGASSRDANLKAALSGVQMAARRAQRGAFWAFVLYRDLLARMPEDFGPETLKDNPNPEDAALRIKQAVTLLETLDPSRFFAQNYVDQLNRYTTVTHLVANVDFSGNADALAAYARAALEQFAAEHGASQDPGLRSAATIATNLVTPTGSGSLDPLGEAFRTARAEVAKLEARDLVGAVEMIAAKLTGAKTAPWIAAAGAKDIALILLKGSFGAAALGLVISGGIAMHDLPAAQRQKVVVGIGVSLAQTFALTARGATSAVGFLYTHGVAWSKLGHTWAQWKAFEAEAVYTRGFAGWVLRSKEGTLRRDAHWADHARALSMPGGRYDFGHDRATVSRLFGRNLDEFMAYRVGAVLGAISLYMAISSLMDASAPLDVASSAVSVAGASFGLIGAAGGWVCSAAGKFAYAARLSAVMSTLAFAATIVVVAIVVYQILKTRETKSEVRKFAEKEAAEAGYYMPFGGAIEYFESLGNVTFQTPDGRFLQMDGNGSLALATASLRVKSGLALTVDSSGKTQIATRPSGGANQWGLNETNGTLTAVEADAATFPWSVDLKGGLVWSGEGTATETLQSARAAISLSGSRPTRHLAVVNGHLALSTTPFTWTLTAESEG